MNKGLQQIVRIAIFASCTAIIIILGGWQTLCVSIAVIAILYAAVSLFIKWQIYKGLQKMRKADEELRKRIKLHYKVKNHSLYETVGQENYQAWLQHIQQQPATLLCAVSQLYEEALMTEECEWLSFIFFTDESHQEVTVIEKLVFDKQIDNIATFCQQYGEQHGIALPFQSRALSETQEIFLYRSSEEDFYLDFS